MPQNATSLKPPAVKAAVALKRGEGKSKAQIAREMRIDRETVTRILADPEIHEALEASRSRCVAMLPKAERAVERQLETGDGDLGLRFLEKSGVLSGQEQHKPSAMFQDVLLNQTLQVLLRSGDQIAVTASPTIENGPADASKRQILSNSHAEEESTS
jgi:hypothetical protein